MKLLFVLLLSFTLVGVCHAEHAKYNGTYEVVQTGNGCIGIDKDSQSNTGVRLLDQQVINYPIGIPTGPGTDGANGCKAIQDLKECVSKKGTFIISWGTIGIYINLPVSIYSFTCDADK